MPGRTIAIGDIHGYLVALRALLGEIAPRPNDTIVTLGDYVDRGPDSRGVIEELIRLRRDCRLVALLGNHDELFLEICGGGLDLLDPWMAFGGDATLASYGARLPEGVPSEHFEFLQGCVSFFESSRHFFIHASYIPGLPLAEQPGETLRWASLRDGVPGPHRCGKIAIVGHTAQRSGEILDVGHLKCIDTCCYGGGWLTALDVETGQIWQADKDARIRPR